MAIEKSAYIRVRVTPEMARRLERAADRAAMTLSDWIRSVLALAADERAFASGRQTSRKSPREG